MYQAPKSQSHIKNTVVLTILTFWHIQCLHLMYAEIAWVLVSSEIQVQPQVIPVPDNLPDYLFLMTMSLTKFQSNHFSVLSSLQHYLSVVLLPYSNFCFSFVVVCSFESNVWRPKTDTNLIRVQLRSSFAMFTIIQFS